MHAELKQRELPMSAQMFLPRLAAALQNPTPEIIGVPPSQEHEVLGPLLPAEICLYALCLELNQEAQRIHEEMLRTPFFHRGHSRLEDEYERAVDIEGFAKEFFSASISEHFMLPNIYPFHRFVVFDGNIALLAKRSFWPFRKK